MSTELINFANLRTQFFDKANCSDLILHIVDFTNPLKPALVIHSHFIVLYSVSDYIRRRLDSLFENDPSRYRLNNQTHLNITLSEVDDEVVRLFFSLFYVNRFDHEQMSKNGLGERVHENILTLYDLAQYFLFDTLIAYIDQYFRESMCLSYLTPLLDFCLQQSPETGSHYIDKKRTGTLFNSLIQWYACCADTTEEANSVAMLGDLSQRVENMEECCRIPRKRARRLSGSKTHLEYYHRICDDCMCKSSKHNTVGAFYYLNLGHLSLQHVEDGSTERFFMRLKKQVNNKSGINKIELTRIRDKPIENEPVRCHTELRLLSRKQRREASSTLVQRVEQLHLNVPTEINSFERNALKHCYEAQCDHCALTKPVYILLLDITITSNNLEDMTMSVEDAVCL